MSRTTKPGDAWRLNKHQLRELQMRLMTDLATLRGESDAAPNNAPLRKAHDALHLATEHLREAIKE